MSGPALTNDVEVLRTWIGRSVSSTDVISARWCRLMQLTLDRPATLTDGDSLPPLWHLISHLSAARLSELGPDGHPARGGFLPPVALPRRMWAGGRFVFSAPISLGETVTKTSTVSDVTRKSGRSGPLCFVTVTHELAVDGEVRLTEAQDLVYRDPSRPGTDRPPGQQAPAEATWQRTVVPTAVQLFRYSALTFNGHRIHYDRDYCRDAEGYPGLVVHGPLTATLLADLAVAESGRRLSRFSFRASAPLFDTERFTIAGSPDGPNRARLWAATPHGGLAMDATAEFADAGAARDRHSHVGS